MPQTRKHQSVNNPDLERVMNDILGKKSTERIVSPFPAGTTEGDALNAVDQSARGTSGNPFRDVGNRRTYHPTPEQRRVSDDILGKKPTEKIINPFPAGTIESDVLNAVDRAARGISGNSFREAGNRRSYNPNPAQRGVFNDVHGQGSKEGNRRLAIVVR
jgi:hypothetical protein